MAKEERISIEWMHPSWRDLVIEHLRISPSERKSFLSHCGLPGFLLALSQAGGASGDRKRPLLVDEDDWSILINSVPRVLSSSDGAASQVLSYLSQSKTGGQGLIEAETGSAKLVELCKEVLLCVRTIWNGGETPGDSAVVAWYYDLSERLSPLPPGPELDGVWRTFFSAAVKEIDEFNSNADEIQVSSIIEFFELARIIRRNEPRFLRQAGFPDCFISVAEVLLKKISERSQKPRKSCWRISAATEDQLFDDLIDISEVISEFFPNLQGDSKKIATGLRKVQAVVIKSLNSLERKEERDYQIYLRKLDRFSKKRKRRATEADWHVSSREINIATLFRDL